VVSFQTTIHSKKICQQTHKKYSVNKVAKMKQVEIINGDRKIELKTLPFTDTYEFFGLGYLNSICFVGFSIVYGATKP
jgi:hypothetical protein